jgi:hypothetical protein
MPATVSVKRSGVIPGSIAENHPADKQRAAQFPRLISIIRPGRESAPTLLAGEKLRFRLGAFPSLVGTWPNPKS